MPKAFMVLSDGKWAILSVFMVVKRWGWTGIISWACQLVCRGLAHTHPFILNVLVAVGPD